MRSGRDTRIDVFRALALLTIFIDHVPGTAFEHLTMKNFGFADAAEAFVLISGMAVGLAYAPKFVPGRRLLTSLGMWRRAGVLYCAHIMTTVATLTIFCAASVFANRPDLLRQINIGPLLDDTARALVGVGLLGHQLGYNNILSMYAVLLILAPAFLWLAAISMRLTLVLSGLLWLTAGIFQIAPPNYPDSGFWFLNPLSWQFLFVIGMTGMTHVRRGGSLPVSPFVAAMACVYVVGAFFWVHSRLWGQVTWLGLPPVFGGFDKTFLSLSRLLDILAIAAILAAFPKLAELARLRIDHPLSVLGRHSLPVFITGTICAMMGQVLKALHDNSFSYDVMLLSCGIGAQFAVAYYLEWLGRTVTFKGASGRPSGDRARRQPA